MNIFNTSIDQLTKGDIINFCQEKEPEGYQLDYKKELPNKLSKSIAAFSNSRGGLILIGIEEDPKSGVPQKWEGIPNDGKLKERVYQIASTVTPLPKVKCEVTDELETGNVFLIIKILPGTSTPYYVNNDSRIYIRTGNISKPIDLSDPKYTEYLHLGKQELIRSLQQNFKDCMFLVDKQKEKWEIIRKNKLNTEENITSSPIGTNSADLEIVLQTDDFSKNYCKRYELINLTRECRASYFPALNLSPFVRGIKGGDINYQTGGYGIEVIKTDGLIYRVEDVLQVEAPGEKLIRLTRLAHILTDVFEFCNKFYKRVAFSGNVIGHIKVKIPDNLTFVGINSSRFTYDIKHSESILNEYTWEIEIDTFTLYNRDLLTEYLRDKLKEIHWDIGIDSTNSDNVIKSFIQQNLNLQN